MSDVATEPLSTASLPPLSSNGLHSQHHPPNSNSEDGLGYSRHYAQRIRDLGRTSKESWIKRLWNHMFGNTNDESELRSGGDTSLRDETSSAPRKNPPKNPEPTKEVRFKEPDTSRPRDDSVSGTSREDSHSSSAPLSKSTLRPFSAHEKAALDGLPVQLLNSPYLPPKDRAGFSLRPKDSGVKSRYMNTMSKSMTALGGTTNAANGVSSSFNPHRQSHPYLTQLAREGTNVAPRSKVTRDASVIQLEKRAKTLSDKAIKKLSDVRCPSSGHSVASGGQSSSLSGQGDWSAAQPVKEDHKLTTGEKRPRVVSPSNPEEVRVAEKVRQAVESSKVFTCDAPYPVDAFVRISLRKRGWVEKFGPKVTNATTVNTSPVKLEVITDEDYQTICDVGFPKPWEEDNGMYAVMSRFVNRCSAKFIWGGKSVNNLVLKSDVIVNHFPKAKYFSSKVLLATSLRDLAWHNNTDSLTFFPRCYLLNDDDKQDIIEDFHLTACMALLKLALDMYNPAGENPLNPSNAAPSDEPPRDENDADVIVTSSDHDVELGTGDVESDPPPAAALHSGTRPEVLHVTDTRDVVEECATQCAADISDDVDDKVVMAKTGQVKVAPDLKAVSHDRKGGSVPVKAIDWAINQCDRYIGSKNHEDIDSRARRGLFPNQWNQLMNWFYQVSQDGATISMSESKLTDCENMLRRIKEVWPQYDLDGSRNIWIIKPGDKSKGIGISFCDDLNEIMQTMKNQGTQEYIIQKYIERPLLIYRCKFDIRQWFLVTDWSPLTVWFYKVSYLRICSQEFNYDSMHESVHLSNVAVQENYLNGNRSEKLPENNFMTSEDFREYLSEVGGDGMWEERIYPGMKEAVINTLVATQEVTDHRKSAFELYGADFMMSEDYTPWLLEVNSSPGMLPSSIDKAKLCAAVIEDTIKVVLDYRENSGCDTGRFELIHLDTTNPNTRGIDSKLLLEGQRIKKPDLQRYAIIDQKAMKFERDREERTKEREQRRRAKAEVEKHAREERERLGEAGSNDAINRNGCSDSAAVDSGCEISSEINTPSCQSPVDGEFTPEEKQDVLASLEASETGNKRQEPGLNKPLREKQASRFALRSTIVDIYSGSGGATSKTPANKSKKTTKQGR